MQAIKELVLDENNMAFHPMMGNSYQLNALGKDIVILLREGKTKYQIIETLFEKYDVAYNDIFIDISDFFAKLRVYGLVR